MTMRFNNLIKQYLTETSCGNVLYFEETEREDVVITYTFPVRAPSERDIQFWIEDETHDLLNIKDIEVDGSTVNLTLFLPADKIKTEALDYLHTSFLKEFPKAELVKNYFEGKKKKKMTHPPRFKGTIKAMMKHKDKFSTDPDSDKMNPYAIAWHMHKKGYKPHYKLNKRKRPVLKKKYKK